MRDGSAVELSLLVVGAGMVLNVRAQHYARSSAPGYH